jgi:PAS domain S-box-containing protein
MVVEFRKQRNTHDLNDVKAKGSLEDILFEKGAEAHFIIKKGVVVKTNRHARRIFNKEEDEWVGFNPYDIKKGLFNYLPDEESLLSSKLEKARDTGRVIKMKLLSKRIDGIEFYSEIKIAQIYPGVEDLQIQDISERDYLDKKIRESEERFRTLSQFAMEGIVFIKNGIIQDANDQFAQIFGYKKVPVDTKITDIIDERDWQRLSAIRNWGMRCELRGKTKQGKPVFLEATRSEANEEGKDQLLMVYDITERKRIEFDLLQTKERFRMLVESSPIGLFLLVDGRIKYTNAGGLDVLNERVEDTVYNELFTSFFKNNEKKTIQEDIESVREGEQPPYREVMMTLSDGLEKEVGIRMTLSFHDRSPAIQITTTDLSTRIQLMREQMRATLAEESNEMLKEEIEKHKKTQHKLIQAEELNKSIIESSIDMIVAFDTEGNLLQYNHAFAVEFGLDPEDKNKINIRDTLSNETQINEVLEAVNTRNYYSGEVEAVRVSGESFPMFVSVAIMRDESGKAFGAMGVGRDITELKISEKELKESEERYRDILDNATDIIFVVDSKGYFTYANPSFYSKLGFSSTTISTVRINSIIGGLKDAKKDWIQELEGKEGETTLLSSSGEALTVIGGSTTQYDSSGTAIGMRGLYLDISEIKQQEAKLASIFETTENLMMFTLNKRGKITTFNNNYKRLMFDGFGVDVELGAPFMKDIEKLVLNKEGRAKLKSLSKVFLGKPQQFELPLKRTTGETSWYQIFLNPITSGSKITEISGVAYDISDRKESDKKIQQALKEKEVLLQEVHHRVKNNLQVISSLMSLQRSFVNDPSLIQVLEESQARISTMSYIHESLYRNKDFSSISFTEYISTLSKNLINSYKTPGCDVELILSSEEVFIPLDQAIPCGLIVNELVSNVMKYAFQGRKKGAISVRVEGVYNKIEIEVSDNGVGLPDDFNLEKNDTLGIYLVQALIEQLSGTLTVESLKEGRKGSLFLISFESQNPGKNGN